jgi:hypothetical protein
MANEFKVKNGLIIDNGGAQVTGGITGSIAATNGVVSGSAQLTTLGYAITGSNSLQGDQQITGSLIVRNDITGSNIKATSGIVGSSIVGSSLTYTSQLGSNAGEIRIQQTSYRNGNQIVFQFSGTTDSNSPRDLGFRRNTSGSLEIYDGNTADGAVANRRDLIARDITGSNAFFSGSSTITGSLGVSGSVIANIFIGTHSGSINATNGVVSSSVQVLGGTGIISSSTQLSGTTITNLTITNLTTVNETASVLFSSGSNTFGDFGDDIHSFTGSVKISGSFALIGASTATSYNGTINATNGVVSGSSQVNFTQLSGISSGIVSSSTQVTPLLPTGTVSGSSQVNFTQLSGISSGIVSSSTQVTPLLPTGTVSGSIQVLGGSTIHSGSANNYQFNSIGVGSVAPSGTAGRIDASGDIVAFSTSDKNFKENITPITNALEKISKISGNTYDWKPELKEFHGFEGNDVGVIAQEIEEILPQLVTTRETGYKAVKYDKLVALLIEGIKEQQQQIHSLTLEVENLKKNKGL